MNSKLTYLRLYLAIGLLYLADQLILFLVPLLIFSVTQDVSFSTWVYAAEWGVRITAGLVSAGLIHRIGTVRTVMLSELGRCTFIVTLVVLMLQGNTAITAVALALIGPAFAFLNSTATVAISTHLPQTIPADKFAQVDAKIATLDQISMISGPALAGVLWDLIPHVGIAITGAVLLAGATLLFYLISREMTGIDSDSPKATIFGFRDAHRFVWIHEPSLRHCLITAVFVNGLIGCAEALGPYALTQRLSQTGSWLGGGSWFGMMNVVSGVLGVLLLSRASDWIQRFGDLTVWRATHIGILVSAIGLSRSWGPAVWIGSFAILIGSAIVGGVGYRNYRAQNVVSERLPVVVSYMWSVGQLGSVLCALISGWIARTQDPFLIFQILGVAFLAWTLYIFAQGMAKSTANVMR